MYVVISVGTGAVGPQFEKQHCTGQDCSWSKINKPHTPRKTLKALHHGLTASRPTAISAAAPYKANGKLVRAALQKPPSLGRFQE